jgi:hypothetical protein
VQKTRRYNQNEIKQSRTCAACSRPSPTVWNLSGNTVLAPLAFAPVLRELQKITEHSSFPNRRHAVNSSFETFNRRLLPKEEFAFASLVVYAPRAFGIYFLVYIFLLFIYIYIYIIIFIFYIYTRIYIYSIYYIYVIYIIYIYIFIYYYIYIIYYIFIDKPWSWASGPWSGASGPWSWASGPWPWASSGAVGRNSRINSPSCRGG